MARRGKVRSGLKTRKVVRPAQGYYADHKGKVVFQKATTRIVNAQKALRRPRG